VEMVLVKDKPLWKQTITKLYKEYYGEGTTKKHNKTGVMVSKKPSNTDKARVFLYPLFIQLRTQKKTDEEILQVFLKHSDRKEGALRRKIRIFKRRK